MSDSKAVAPTADWEKTLEQTEQQVIEGKIDTIDTEARYLGTSPNSCSNQAVL